MDFLNAAVLVRAARGVGDLRALATADGLHRALGKEADRFRGIMSGWPKVLASLNLPISARIARGYIGGINENTLVGVICSNVENIYDAMAHEMEDKLFLEISGESKQYFENRMEMFGDKTNVAFPSSVEDIAEACKARSFEMWTACVMHLMRALETPLSVLCRHFGIEKAPNWNTTLNLIDKAFGQTGSTDDKLWVAQVSAHFRAVKNAWRNDAMHGALYDKEEAIQIFENVRSLMKTLAKHLHE